MKRRQYLLTSGLAISTLAGCTGDNQTNEDETTTSTEVPTTRETATTSSTQTDDGEETPQNLKPFILEFGASPVEDFEGEGIPTGAPVEFSFEYEAYAAGNDYELEFQIRTFDGDRELDSLTVTDDQTPKGEDEFVERERLTTVKTRGYPEGEVKAEIIAIDRIQKLESAPSSITFISAGYTQTRYRQTVDLLESSKSELDSAVENYRTYHGREITDVVGDAEFDGASITEQLESAESDVSTALEYQVDPFLDELEDRMVVIETLLSTVSVQEKMTQAATKSIEPLALLLEWETSKATESADEFAETLADLEGEIEQCEAEIDDSVEYPVEIDEKMDQFRGEFGVLEVLHDSIDNIADSIVVLEKAAIAYELEAYRDAQLNAGDAATRFEEINEEFESLGYLDSTVGKYSSTVEELRKAAEEIRQDAIDQQ